MKYTFLLLLVCFELITSFAQETDFICKDLDHLIALESASNGRKLHFERNIYTQNYDLKYHRMEWTIDPSVHYIKGAITSYFVPTKEGFDKIHFDLVNNMTINSVMYHGNALTAEFVEDDILGVQFPTILEKGTLDSITIAYEGAPQSGGFGSFAIGKHGDQNTPVMWTLSEPYGAKAWWPCKQDLIDKIDSIDIYVRTLKTYRAASNGKLVEEIIEGNEAIYHWKHRYAIPAYLIAIAVTDYAVFSDFVPLDNGDSIEILNYVYPENLESFKTSYKSTVDIMSFFNEKFGVYPFADEKYGHAQFGWGGGMEHQTMSFMGSASYGLQAHELAHQWFGDKVTCGSWEDIWLNEGFATYLTGLCYEFLGSENSWESWKNQKIQAVVNNPNGSVWVDDTTSVGRIFNSRLSYSKGSYVLHMLRGIVGDNDFFQACRNYLDDPALAYGYAHTIDLINHFESVTGLDLTEYFSDWIYGEGFPIYNLEWSTESNGVKISLFQDPSNASVSFFEMPVQVQLIGAGRDTLISLDHSFSGQEFVIDVSFDVDDIKFDPEKWILCTSSVKQVVSAIELEELINNSIVINPNPFNDVLQIKLKNLNHLVIDKIEIFDLMGRKIDEFTPKSNLFEITTAHWANGTYVLKLEAGNKYGSKLIIKKQ